MWLNIISKLFDCLSHIRQIAFCQYKKNNHSHWPNIRTITIILLLNDLRSWKLSQWYIFGSKVFSRAMTKVNHLKLKLADMVPSAEFLIWLKNDGNIIGILDGSRLLLLKFSFFFSLFWWFIWLDPLLVVCCRVLSHNELCPHYVFVEALWLNAQLAF